MNHTALLSIVNNVVRRKKLLIRGNTQIACAIVIACVQWMYLDEYVVYGACIGVAIVGVSNYARYGKGKTE